MLSTFIIYLIMITIMTITIMTINQFINVAYSPSILKSVMNLENNRIHVPPLKFDWPLSDVLSPENWLLLPPPPLP